MKAVLTGDIVDFTKLKQSDSDQLLNVLERSFKRIKGDLSDSEAAFDLYRGDSFQGILSDPTEALRAVLLIRSMVRAAQPEQSAVSWDIRIAIGLGTVERLSERPTEGDGEAFRRSGPALDKMKLQERMALQTPWKTLNEEFKVSLALTDAVVAKWSPGQAEVTAELLLGKSRQLIARELNISQPAVSYRVKGAGWYAVEPLLKRYDDRVLQALENNQD
jgi:hypothetical protein